jgi:hypothetical protein
MAFDYVLKFPCEVRKSVPEAKLVALVRYMSLAEFAVAEIRRSNPNVAMETILGKYEVHVSQSRPDGTATQVPMTIGQLVALAQPVRQYLGHCQKCPANIAARPFGCIAKINYPLKKESEEWLLSRLPANVADPNLSLLFRFLSDLEIGSAQQVTSSQMLQILAFSGDIAPQQAALYTKLLGLNSVLSNPHPPSDNIEQFKTLMCAVVMSGRLTAEINVDS